MDAKGKCCRLSTQRVPGVDVRCSPGTEGARIVPVVCQGGTEGARQGIPKRHSGPVAGRGNVCGAVKCLFFLWFSGFFFIILRD